MIFQKIYRLSNSTEISGTVRLSVPYGLNNSVKVVTTVIRKEKSSSFDNS
jgi:hypothetical protein